eukprot:CAMPEP_0204279316 /NCGR_PEP_ID=MMETSP0468-20130131/34795_1 /ASSEMBLY_ACC=CAM_ASM_000383 /TAXON_ID=2969 /ORGANISM="Oxyrrhis marina" /LENGTH=81 /DNA_ID=CAMNT_0051256389 /DNA_START=281 /DNA_END=526 /DNA_ORIENTATION=+
MPVAERARASAAPCDVLHVHQPHVEQLLRGDLCAKHQEFAQPVVFHEANPDWMGLPWENNQDGTCCRKHCSAKSGSPLQDV